MESTLPRLPIFEAITRHDPKSTAVINSLEKESFPYGELLKDVADAKKRLLETAGSGNVAEQRVAFHADNGYDYVVTLLSIMASQAIAVPLNHKLPVPEIQHVLNDCEAAILLSGANLQKKLPEILNKGPLRKTILGTSRTVEGRPICNSSSSKDVMLEVASLEGHENGALMLYTSGTTSRPKGVLLPQRVITAQCQSLLEAWSYSPSDHLLHVLPMHHIHGVVNGLLAPLFAGSTIEIMSSFNPDSVWRRLASPFHQTEEPHLNSRPKITFFTAVPTIYDRLLETHKLISENHVRQAARRAISPSNLRLNISGSVALSTSTKEAWKELSGGNVLLERYGMTEVGMALSCGLDFVDRVTYSVGWPLPSVQVRLVELDTGEIIQPGEDFNREGRQREGEIQIRGPTVFHSYWGNREATASGFVDGEDGKREWFKTGDVACRHVVEGTGNSKQGWAKGPMYFIRGRKSQDIIKSGGEKISTLEIERELLSLPQIAEAVVVGPPSDKWGQIVAAIVVLNPEHASLEQKGRKWGLMDMRRALSKRLVNYKIPVDMKIVEEIPRNTMGKINKKSLIEEYFPDKP